MPVNLCDADIKVTFPNKHHHTQTDKYPAISTRWYHFRHQAKKNPTDLVKWG